jgi:hypothetical protein
MLVCFPWNVPTGGDPLPATLIKTKNDATTQIFSLAGSSAAGGGGGGDASILCAVGRLQRVRRNVLRVRIFLVEYVIFCLLLPCTPFYFWLCL